MRDISPSDLIHGRSRGVAREPGLQGSASGRHNAAGPLRQQDRCESTGDGMQVARLHGIADLRLSDEAAPVPGPGMSLVKVTAVGICGSDLHWWAEGGIGDAVLERPLVPGHEAAGIIGDGPRRGERVAIDPAIACGTCRPCRSGYRNLCTRIRFAGHGTHDGAMRNYLAWPSDLLHPLPDALTDADGAMLEPLGVAIHAADLAPLRLGGSRPPAARGPIGLA